MQAPRLFRCGFTKIRTPFHATVLTEIDVVLENFAVIIFVNDFW